MEVILSIEGTEVAKLESDIPSWLGQKIGQKIGILLKGMPEGTEANMNIKLTKDGNGEEASS